jgi:hypothetical protein
MMFFRGWTRGDKLLLIEEIMEAFGQIEELARMESADNAPARPASEATRLIPQTEADLRLIRNRILGGENHLSFRNNLIKIHKAALLCLQIAYGAAAGRDKFNQMLGRSQP